MPEEQLFTKQDTCAKCYGPLNQQDNRGCIHGLVNPFDVPNVLVEVHIHAHIGCLTGMMKWKALSSLGQARSEFN